MFKRFYTHKPIVNHSLSGRPTPNTLHTSQLTNDIQKHTKTIKVVLNRHRLFPTPILCILYLKHEKNFKSVNYDKY